MKSGSPGLDRRVRTTKSGAAALSLQKCNYFEQMAFLVDKTANLPTESNVMIPNAGNQNFNLGSASAGQSCEIQSSQMTPSRPSNNSESILLSTCVLSIRSDMDAVSPSPSRSRGSITLDNFIRRKGKRKSNIDPNGETSSKILKQISDIDAEFKKT